MDFLTQLSIRYTEKSAVVDEEDPDDQGEKIKCVCFWTRLELETKVKRRFAKILQIVKLPVIFGNLRLKLYKTYK